MQLVSTENKKFLLEPIVKNRKFGQKSKEDYGKPVYLFRNQIAEISFQGTDLMLDAQDEIDY